MSNIKLIKVYRKPASSDPDSQNTYYRNNVNGSNAQYILVWTTQYKITLTSININWDSFFIA